MKNYIMSGALLPLTPAVAVASGVGHLFGVGLFGVATDDCAINTEGTFAVEGVVDIAKTSALAITTGDRLYWDPAAKVVNKTATAQQCVGIAVGDAANPSATVRMKIGAFVAVAA